MKRILHITIALLLLAVAGQNAWATTKTVTYTLSREIVNQTDYFALTHSGDTPFDGTTTVQHQQETGSTQATFHLPDGFTFNFTWGSGATVTSVGSSSYFYCGNANVRFSLSWGLHRYVTAVSITDDQGNPSALNSSGTASTAFTYSEQGQVSYTLKTYASFVKLNITYTDAPDLSVFESAGNNTYKIKSAADLRHLADYVNNGRNDCSGLTFQQTQDISFTHTTAWNDASSTESNHTAIGSTSRFRGTYDGQGKAISGIRVYSDDSGQGLFAFIDGHGTVKRVNLADARITGKGSVGGIVGYISIATVEDCTVSANVCVHAVTDGLYHGGIAGQNYGNVLRCLSRATLTKDTNASGCSGFGAIVGYNLSDEVMNCIAISATVPNVEMPGAIIGYDTDKHIQSNYYRDCTVGGAGTNVGVGYDSSSSYPHDVTDNQGAQALYSLTLPSGVTLNRTPEATLPGTGNATYTTGADIDGTPYAFSGATVTLNYSGDVPFGKAVVYSATAGTIDGSTLTMPAADVTVSATLVDNLWGDAYGADGSAEKPFRISTPADLDLLAQRVNSGTGDDYAASGYSGIHFLQSANLIYDGTENNYTAIGTSSHPFSGHYDGGKKTIRGININKTGTDANADCYLGIFGYVDGGTIERLALAGSTIVGYRYVGGIAGYLNGTIQNCRVEDNVTVSTESQNDSYQFFGGVAGRLDQSGIIQGCVCGARVNSTNGNILFCGGIVGHSGGTLRSNVYFGTSVYGISIKECGAILGEGYYSYNNFYTATSGVPKGKGNHESSKNSDVMSESGNASCPKLLTLGEHVAIVGDEVKYTFSGLTDLGGKALRYYDGHSVRTFTHTEQTITLCYDGNVPEGKSVAFCCRATWTDSFHKVYYPISGTEWNIKKNYNINITNDIGAYDSFTINATLVSNTVTITAKPALGGYWTTFYSSAGYIPSGGAVAYIVNSSGQLDALDLSGHAGINGTKIRGCVAVVIFSDKPNVTLTRVDNIPLDAVGGGNILLGSDDPVPVVNGKVDGKTPYVLGVVDGVFGFYPFTGTEIPANKAYYLQ